MRYAIEHSAMEEDGIFLYLRNNKTGKCPGFNLRWRWQCLSERQTGIDLPFVGFTFNHSKYIPHVDLYGSSSLGWRVSVGKVDTDWNGAKVLIFRQLLGRHKRWRTWDWGVAIHEPVFRGKWSDNTLPDLPDDREPCPGGCGVLTEPYAPCGSEQCRDKSADREFGEWGPDDSEQWGYNRRWED